MRRYLLIRIMLVTFLLAACHEKSSNSQNEAADIVQEADDLAEKSAADQLPILNLACSGETGLKPKTIFEFVDMVNGLPKPLTLPCLVNALAKPLKLIATDSRMSVQPAQGRDRPRIFFLHEGLILSVVPGEPELELGEIYQESLSIKAELKFPLTAEIGLDAPFLTVGAMSNGGKRCGTYCHKTVIELEPVGEAMVYASQIIRPNPLTELPLEELRQHAAQCRDDEACLLYQAIFSSGMPLPFAFDPSLPTF
ncbi:MAG: hypothetical protein ACOH5I_00125 [Oligoflexus sp.]